MASTINIISDAAVLIIPLASIMKLQTTRQKKLAIWALFAFGALAPLASLSRLGYQIPVANGENKTVIYPIVLILATAEQTVAMIGGSAPVASAAVIRLMWRKLPAASPNRTVSQRVWPAREAKVSRINRQGQTPDPFPITDGTLAGSTEILYSTTTIRQSDSNYGEAWEMNKSISNADKVTSHTEPAVNTIREEND
jgi:hypothetical protein